MDEIIKRISILLSELDTPIKLVHPGAKTGDFPYCSYEYNSLTTNNMYTILFTIDVNAETADEAETLAIKIRKKLHDDLNYSAESAFKITAYPQLSTLNSNELNVHIKRLNFTIIAYFKED